ncbi:MAG: hypothetical protein A2015_13020 [Spirochaetes bacterium GWF1_31_7]|nr:MAG: hypothetical protein A2Y30_00425 [Spirochaetes bacterium GWE1_32_154]OHD51307.1 MAG: hypothetical protein A2Y29_00870 [Spirochaetes bacterium GWE2_31_10]OHD51504.1 MAG: hypothetical protein A2015_13020 [Spirochaetes bacterium GWF1_31_7]
MAAEIEHISISKYAVKKLNESMHSKWPDHYADLYGCISDDTFEIVKINNFNNDIPREEL